MTPPSQGWQVCCLRRACCCWPYIDILPLQSAPSHIPSLSSSDIFGNLSEHNYVIHLIVDTALRPNECFKISECMPNSTGNLWCLTQTLTQNLKPHSKFWKLTQIFGVVVLTTNITLWRCGIWNLAFKHHGKFHLSAVWCLLETMIQSKNFVVSFITYFCNCIYMTK